MHETIIIAAITTLAYAGVQVPLWLLVRALRHLPTHDRERSEFVIEKMLHASKQSGQLCRLCNNCGRVVHSYDLLADGTVQCLDCKAGIGG